MEIAIKEAKEEVFEDFDKHFKEWEDLNFNNYEEIKQHHLSTSQSEGTELSFKVPSHSSDKPCPICDGKGKVTGCRYCKGTGKARL